MSDPIAEEPATTVADAPKFVAPNLLEIITGRLKESVPDAKARYGLVDQKIDPKAMAQGIKACQREIDEWAASLTPGQFLADAAGQQVGEDKVAALRGRVRCAPDAPVSELILAVLQGKWARTAIMLCPMNAPIEPWVHWAHLALIKRMPWVGYDQVCFPSITYARNKLVQSFLSTEAEWSFWLDSDTVCPIGDPGAFYHRFGANPKFIKPEFLEVQGLERLASRQKTLIGGVVADRHPGNRLIIQPDLNPHGDEDRDLVKKLKKEGPQDKVIQVPYAGTGCLLVHRNVYVEIMKKFPERGPLTAGEPFNFFGGGTGVDAQGEDIAFCKLAYESGHPAWLDLSVWCAHVGTHPFFPQNQI